jgi:hypothetical protein
MTRHCKSKSKFAESVALNDFLNSLRKSVEPVNGLRLNSNDEKIQTTITNPNEASKGIFN